jgi:hypothetical protein
MLVYCIKCGKEYVLESIDKLSDFQCECGGDLDFNDSTEKKGKIPDNYKKNIYIGYFALMLLLISSFLKIVVNSIDGSWMVLLIRITFIIGMIIFVYFVFIIYKLKDDIMNDPSFKYHKLFILLILAGLLIIAHNITSL